MHLSHRGARWISGLGASALLIVTRHAVDPGKPSEAGTAAPNLVVP